MNKLKKFFSLIISLMLFSTLFVINCTVVKADDLNKGEITSVVVPSNVKEYASTAFSRHLYDVKSMPDEYGLGGCDLTKLILGQPFNLYQFENDRITNTEIYYFPISYNNTIKAILSVTKSNDGSLTSTFSTEFASQLNTVLSENPDNDYRIVSMNNEIRAIDDSNAILLEKDINSDTIKNVDSNTISEINNEAQQNLKDNDYNEYNPSIIDSDNNKITPNIVIKPKYVSLKVPYVSQEDKNWCWAATCASIINYKKGKDLTAASVVKYIFGSEKNVGGDVSDELKAYKHWGLAPDYDGSNCKWSTATLELDNGNPIDSGWYTLGRINGHSMTVRGYQCYDTDDSRTYFLIDPNVGYVSVDGRTDSGDCVYVMGGKKYYWEESIFN